jgi:hypothetical protein
MKAAETKRLTPQKFVDYCEATGVSKIVVCTGSKFAWFMSYNLDNIRANGGTILINEGDSANNSAVLNGVDFIVKCADTEYNDVLYEDGFTGFFVCRMLDTEAIVVGMIRVR